MRRSSFGSGMRAIVREIARAERARQQQEAARRREIQNTERQVKANAKEDTRLHLAAQLEETELLNRDVAERDKAIETLLGRSLTVNPSIDLNSMLKVFNPRWFDERPWTSAAPDHTAFMPKLPGFFMRMIPGTTRRHERRIEETTRHFETAEAAHQARVKDRSEALKRFEAEQQGRKAEIERDNSAVRELQRGLAAAEHSAVVAYLKLVIEKSLKGEPDAVSSEIGYSPDSRHLVVDLELPELSVVPEETNYKYVKATDRIEPVARPLAKRKSLYAHLLCQVALKCIDTVYRGSSGGVVDCLTLNGMLDTIDPAVGKQVRVCLLSVRVTRDVFGTLNLSKVQPEHCLRSLKASVSRAPAELLPVKPLVELDMVDPRFVNTLDVMSGLDQRPNLMELTPTEFEGLITNLFAAMGLDTRQTRPSRDGGVDCVAFDSRPIFGGKVVIQAKRYKNTVGVSAVRDLFGTVQNEGASKGILVTTSGYGKAAFEFAAGKPLELLDGGNLLHLLAEHAGIEARIVMPDGWVDLPVHGE
jgi:restriction system protein